MVGIITQENIDQIRETFGAEIAERAASWPGTFLDFLVSEGIL
jgi:hypothetical protein